MAVNLALLFYQSRLHELQAELAQVRSNQTVTVLVLAAAAILFFSLGFLAVSLRAAPLWCPPLAVPIAVISLRKYKRNFSAWLRLTRLERFCHRGLERVEGRWQGTGVTGEEFGNSNHVYEKDLDIFGVGSLFELLCTARTEIGQRRLANYLLETPQPEAIIARQEAVKELQSRTGLRESIALLGSFEFLESRRETFTAWLDRPAAPAATWIRIVAFITSSSLACLFMTGLLALLPWSLLLPWMGALILFHSVFGLTMRKGVNAEVVALRSIGLEIEVLRQGLELLGGQRFNSSLLNRIVQQAGHGQGAKSLRKIEPLVHALRERDKDWFYLPSRLLLAGTQLSLAIGYWRTQNRAALTSWLDAWGEFEALNALAGYANEHPDDTFPQLVDGEAAFEAAALGHPLLPENTCIRNDVNLNAAADFYIVSGSNMSGKSTLLRAIGTNAVLAFAGAPVRAARLRLSPFSICASVSVGDSLLNGKSKFLAEVERLRQGIELSMQRRPVLFLIDEIFSGTNSRDRRIAAESVVRTLVEHGAVGMLSTHDLALTEIAELKDLHGLNVHMGSRDGAGPMDFDYLLKAGVTRETNALAIARLAGVPV